MWHHQDFPHGVCSQRGHRQGPLAWTMPVHQQHITVLPAPVISTIPRPRNKLRFYMLSIPSWKIGWQVPENKNRRAGLWMAISTGICRQHSEKCLSGLWFIQKLFCSVPNAVNYLCCLEFLMMLVLVLVHRVHKDNVANSLSTNSTFNNYVCFNAHAKVFSSHITLQSCVKYEVIMSKLHIFHCSHVNLHYI